MQPLCDPSRHKVTFRAPAEEHKSVTIMSTNVRIRRSGCLLINITHSRFMEDPVFHSQQQKWSNPFFLYMRTLCLILDHVDRVCLMSKEIIKFTEFNSVVLVIFALPFTLPGNKLPSYQSVRPPPWKALWMVSHKLVLSLTLILWDTLLRLPPTYFSQWDAGAIYLDTFWS